MASHRLPCALLAVVSCACSSKGSALSSEKKAELTKAVGALRSVDPEVRSGLAATAIAEIEAERLPKPLVEALASATRVSPDMRSMILTDGIAQSIGTLETLCLGKGVEMMRAAGAAPPTRRLGLIREMCKTDRFHLVDNPAPNTDAMAYLMGHLVYSHLEENGGVSREETELIRALASATAAPTP